MLILLKHNSFFGANNLQFVVLNLFLNTNFKFDFSLIYVQTTAHSIIWLYFQTEDVRSELIKLLYCIINLEGIGFTEYLVILMLYKMMSIIRNTNFYCNFLIVLLWWKANLKWIKIISFILNYYWCYVCICYLLLVSCAMFLIF